MTTNVTSFMPTQDRSHGCLWLLIYDKPAAHHLIGIVLLANSICKAFQTPTWQEENDGMEFCEALY